jgi:hypothetical protein
VIWNPAYTWKVFMAGGSFYISLQVVNLWLGSLGILQLGYLLLLGSPAGIFYNFVRELGQARQASVTAATHSDHHPDVTEGSG